ncbi:cytochrome c biogenesis CcdA family protein [Demequina aestuarii]|uniref:cytochrome c biogenesis CcdA family protein n=1 Tax=Demequina aestuarii TaxID=327095 RepID=UPI0007865B70|nr:cytochrome c biogenesis CcdA family protein [Demequina aestuarii]
MLDATVAAYVLLLGAVAAFNPCGFALLPAYLTVIVTGSADAGVTRAVALRRAVGFGLAMTLGFMVVFTGFGLLFGAVSLGLQGSVLPYVSYVTVAIGAVLVWLGLVMLRGGQLRGPGLRITGHAPRRAFWSQVGYGASFAVASLSCTIGLFLAVVAHALAATGPVAAVAPFFIYGAGMGASVLAISMVAAVAGSAAASTMRRHTPLLMRVGGGLMVVAGLYVLVFGLAEVLLQYGIDTLNPVLTTTAQWQSGVSAWIESWGTAVLVIFVAIVAAAAGAILVAARRGGTSGRARVSVDGEGDRPPRGSAPGFTVADPATLESVRRASRG